MNKVGDINVNYPGCPRILCDGEVWKPCDGRLLSRKSYPVLYGLIQQTYADEDKRCCNAELFPLPDLRDHSTSQSDEPTPTSDSQNSKLP